MLVREEWQRDQPAEACHQQRWRASVYGVIGYADISGYSLDLKVAESVNTFVLTMDE